MYSGQRVSRHNQALEAMAFDAVDDGGDFDEYGVPAKNRPASKRGGLLNRFKRSSTSASHNDDSDDDIVPDVLNRTSQPGMGAMHPGMHQGMHPGMNQGMQPGMNPGMSPNKQSGFQVLHGPPRPASAQSQSRASIHSKVSTGSRMDGEISMDQLSQIKDRFRYPTMAGDPSGGRTMSLNSMSNYDTAPIIPMLGSLPGASHNKQTDQEKYRQRMIESRRALMNTESGVPVVGPPGSGVPVAQSPMRPGPGQMGPGQMGPMNHMNHMGRPGSPMGYMNQGSPMPQGMPGSPMGIPGIPGSPMSIPGMSGGPGMPGSPMAGNGMRSMSMTSVNSMPARPRANTLGSQPYFGQPPSPYAPPGSQPMPNSPNHPRSGSGGFISPHGMPPQPFHKPHPLSSEMHRTEEFDFGNSRILELEDEVRVLSIELSESVRREQRLHSNTKTDSLEELASAYKQLSLERSKFAEKKYPSSLSADELSELRFGHGEATHLLAERTAQYDALQTRFALLETDFKEKEQQLEELTERFGQLGESREQYTQDKNLLTQVNVLRDENQRLRTQLDEVSDQGPLGDRVRSLEEQRSALQDAMRAMRERKDAEIRSLQIELDSLVSTRARLGSGSESRAVSTASITSLSGLGNMSTSSLQYPVPRRLASEPEDLQVPRIRQSGRPASPLNIGLEYK